MRKNKHVPYIRRVEGAKRALLCCHGIMGSPNHFRDLIPLVPDDVSIYNIALAGHCGTVSDFAHGSMEQWEKNIEDTINEILETHEEIYVLSHSMGTLLTVEQAMKNPNIKKLFCISIPIKVGIRAKMFSVAAKVYLNRVRDDDELMLACMECYGISPSKNVFKYMAWVPRFIELFKKIKYIKDNIGKLETPCIAFQSVPDEMVSPKSINILREKSKIDVRVLENSTHFYYDKNDLEFLKQEFIKFIS